ncbi:MULTISPECIES: sensor histidine kinase [Sphingobacterium]|uniref:sensor histidine kinase n=1 Tax=Sphingobacterium TaxID=28453 RepID=UPI0013D8ED0C|nr:MULTISPECIES: sensor histidine kinase [unclassified Sphingobacterium]
MRDTSVDNTYNVLSRFKTWQLLALGLLSALFVIYPDITWLPYELKELVGSAKSERIILLLIRYSLLSTLIFLLVGYNLKSLHSISLRKRFFINLMITLITFAIYGGICYLLLVRVRHYGSLVLFQFFIVAVLSTLVGHIAMLYLDQRKKNKEIQELRVQNLQSSYDALTNQINPHFFFNSLNGLASLIRKKEDRVTLTYLDKLSDVFRYILQSHKKGLVTLAEELAFVSSFQYMMEVRFSDKLQYSIEIEKSKLTLKLPVLSVLPLLDNIVVHNVVDSDHKMLVKIWLNEQDELCISNPIYSKLVRPTTNGTGLDNLESRFKLLLGQSIRVQDDGQLFTVILPLK